MASTTTCYSLVRGRAMRVTRLDGCGQKVLGPDSQIVTDGFISVALTANTDTGTAISVTNAAGAVCILDEPCPKFTGYSIEIDFCGVDPDLIHLVTGQSKVQDAQGNNTGFRMNTNIDACDSGFALELWSNVPAAACDVASGASYGYMLIPFVKGGVIGDFTVGDDAVNFIMTGANTKDGTGWGVGPYDVTRDQSNLAGPLNEALDSYDHLHVELVTVAPPSPTCGASALGIPATGADAGTPGTYTPANSYGPADFASITGLTASPSTAWQTNEHIVLRDGTLAYWDGSAWTQGSAP